MSYKQIGLALLTGVLVALIVFIFVKSIIVSVIFGGVAMGTLIRLEIEKRS
jgi:hypothetical protein